MLMLVRQTSAVRWTALTSESPKEQTARISNAFAMQCTLVTIQAFFPIQVPQPKLSKERLSNLSTHTRDLNSHVAYGADTPKRHEPPANPPIHPPPIQRHDNQQPQKCDQQRNTADNQCPTNIDRVRLILDLLPRVPLAPLLAPAQRHLQPTDPNPKQDIQHRTPKTSAERHHGISKPSDCDIGDKIAETVAHGEDREAEDGVADAEDDAEGFEHANDFVGDCANPGDRDDEAEEAEEGTEAGRFVRIGG